MRPVRELAERLIKIPGVVAVALGGSRAGGPIHPDSDWDFGLYYRDAISADAVRALGFEGTVVEPGEWGRLVNGGARLTVDGQRVDLLYRDLDVVRHWIEEAEAGRYEVDRVEGHLAGMATYVLAGELARAEVLAGELPRPEFPGPLRQVAPRRWRASAAFSLAIADTAAGRHDVVSCAGCSPRRPSRSPRRRSPSAASGRSPRRASSGGPGSERGWRRSWPRRGTAHSSSDGR
jgi:predicted nucleotidyltransferase